jgi:hypothetical protein
LNKKERRRRKTDVCINSGRNGKRRDRINPQKEAVSDFSKSSISMVNASVLAFS